MEKGKNKRGLSRYIESEKKLLIRQECGFGCIVCGMTIYTYEHIDPEFADALEHDPKKMGLLCGSCHLKVTKGIWSKDKIKTARSNPYCLRRGFSNDFFDVGEPFGVSVGRIYYTKNKTGELLRIDGQTVLSVSKTEGEPPKLSGLFCDGKGNKLFEIRDNEWLGSVDAWDIEAVGSRLTIKDGKDSILIQINARPPYVVAIEIANLNYRNDCLISNEETGQIIISTATAAHIDAQSGIIITEGPVVIEKGKLTLHNGSIVMLAQEGVPMNRLNFEKYILTGEISS